MELAKSRAMRAIRANVIYVLTCSSTNFPKASQLLMFTCQHANVLTNVSTCQLAKGVPIFQFGVLTSQYFNLACQRAKSCDIFSTSPAKTCANFSNELYFFIYLIYFIYFVYFKYIPNIYFLYEYIFLT